MEFTDHNTHTPPPPPLKILRTSTVGAASWYIPTSLRLKYTDITTTVRFITKTLVVSYISHTITTLIQLELKIRDDSDELYVKHK